MCQTSTTGTVLVLVHCTVQVQYYFLQYPMNHESRGYELRSGIRGGVTWRRQESAFRRSGDWRRAAMIDDASPPLTSAILASVLGGQPWVGRGAMSPKNYVRFDRKQASVEFPHQSEDDKKRGCCGFSFGKVLYIVRVRDTGVQ